MESQNVRLLGQEDLAWSQESLIFDPLKQLFFVSQSVRIKKHIQFNVSVKFNYIFILWESVLSLNSICDMIKSQKRNPRPQTGRGYQSFTQPETGSHRVCCRAEAREARPLNSWLTL